MQIFAHCYSWRPAFCLFFLVMSDDHFFLQIVVSNNNPPCHFFILITIPLFSQFTPTKPKDIPGTQRPRWPRRSGWSQTPSHTLCPRTPHSTSLSAEESLDPRWQRCNQGYQHRRSCSDIPWAGNNPSLCWQTWQMWSSCSQSWGHTGPGIAAHLPDQEQDRWRKIWERENRVGQKRTDHIAWHMKRKALVQCTIG